MTAYRFRVKFDPDPTSLWRDIVVGRDRTVDEFQSAINVAVGLDQSHLWFVGVDEDYWDSDVKYRCSHEFEDLPDGGPAHLGAETFDAGETTLAEMARQFGLTESDRICYLYDYGDEWRFYGILKEVVKDAPDTKELEVVKKKGDSIQQY